MRTPKLLSVVALVAMCLCAFAGGEINGKVIDSQTKETLPGAVVIFACQGNELYFTTNDNGLYYATNLPAGVYDISVSFMSQKTLVMKQVPLSNGEIRSNIDLTFDPTIKFDDIVVEGGKSRNPLMPTVITEGETYLPETLKHMAITKVTDIPLTGGTVQMEDGKTYVRGAREGAMSYYVDNCKLMGPPYVPVCGLDFFQSYPAYVPAKYGDCLGGVVVMETKSYFSLT